MSTTKSMTVHCDHQGCGSASGGTFSVAGTDRPGTARDAAAQMGWTRKGAQDFCPLHEADAREDDQP